MQLQPLPEGRRAKRMAAQSAAGAEGALAVLVGGRPQLRRPHPPRACRWGTLCVYTLRACHLVRKDASLSKLCSYVGSKLPSGGQRPEVRIQGLTSREQGELDTEVVLLVKE